MLSVEEHCQQLLFCSGCKFLLPKGRGSFIVVCLASMHVLRYLLSLDAV